MTIYETILGRGYFPKELPPAFFTAQFARYATTKSGRTKLAAYKPTDNFTECVRYQLALPGLNRRELRIPHPASFSTLACLTAKNLKRLLHLAGRSKCAKSRPIYATGKGRSLFPMVKPSNLARERAISRGGASFLLKADVSQFYGSLYTHAVGWAVDPALRAKANWKKHWLLGKKLDVALMNLDGKVSQGIPIGNDVSYLLSELVLARVDHAMRFGRSRAYRWFDDYEIAFDTREEAHACLKRLRGMLGRFRLRLNSHKTEVIELPRPAQEKWQELLVQTVGTRFRRAADMLKHFDTAFRLREEFPSSPVLLYAMGVLFSVRCPSQDIRSIAQSCITQALLCEPGAAQKAFALLSYWQLNGCPLDSNLIGETINKLVLRHEAGGLSSDVSWALAFCLQQNIELGPKAAKLLSIFEDDCVALQALHMHHSGLLPRGFKTGSISKMLKAAELDREHWLITYEAARQGFLNDSEAAVKNDPLFSDLLAQKVTFYRTTLPSYALVLHPGGAPEWTVRAWLELVTKPDRPPKPGDEKLRADPVLQLVERDLPRLDPAPQTSEDAIVRLMDVLAEGGFEGGGYSADEQILAGEL